MTVRWAFRTLSFVKERSLRKLALSFLLQCGSSATPVNLLQGQNQASLFLGHFSLKAPLVESLAHGSNATSRASPCDESSSALFGAKLANS